MKKAVGLAKSEHDAERAVAKLSETGFDAESITVLGDVGAFWQTLGCTPAEIVATDFGTGAALGLAVYALCGVLAAVAELTLGFDNQIAIEVLIVFGLLGVMVGGFLGLIFGMGEMEDEGRTYVRSIQSGGKLVMVRTADEHAQRALQSLQASDLQAVKLCTRHAPMHTELMHAHWATDRLSSRIRWTARVLSVALILAMLTYFIGAALVGGGMSTPTVMSLVDSFRVLTLLMALVGVVVAWRWEAIGAVLIAGSVLLFIAINTVTVGAWQFSPLGLLSLVVAALFLWDWWRREKTYLSSQPVQHF